MATDRATGDAGRLDALDEGDERSAASRSFVGSAVATSSLTATYTALLFATTIILARLLGPESYGVYAIVTSVTAMVGVFATPGLENLLIRDLAAYGVSNDHSRSRGLMRVSSRLTLWIGLVLTVVLCLVTFVVHGWVLDSFTTTMVVGSLVIPVAALSRVRAASLVGLHRVVLSRLPELVVRPLSLLALVGIGVLVGLSTSPEGAMAATVAAYAASYLVGALVLRRVMPAAIPVAEPRYDAARWRKSAPAFLALALTDILNSQLSVSLVGWLDTARSAGIFAVANRGAALVALAFVGIAAVVAPRIARLWEAQEYDAVSRLLLRCSVMSAGFAIPVVVAVAVLDKRLLALFGSGFKEGAAAFLIVALGQLAWSVVGIYATALLMTGGENRAALCTLISLVTTVVLSVVLVPRWGADGAALAWTASMVLAQGFTLVFWFNHRRSRRVTVEARASAT